ncbi:MAG: YidH family protein [Rhodanobacteraceae bacterium]
MAEATPVDPSARLRELVDLQAEVCYMNVDRTLATWTRTALALIVFGTVVDRYGLLLARNHPLHLGTLLAMNPESSIGGLFLVALGVLIAASAAIRHQAYRRKWIREYAHPGWHGPWLALVFATGTVIAGLALLIVLAVFRQ